MKNASWILLVLFVIAGIAWGVWAIHEKAQKTLRERAALAQAQMAISLRNNHFLQRNGWQQYHDTREEVLRDNPPLAAEYQAILAERTQQQADLDAAMIKADPQVAPIVAKLALLRQKNTPPTPASAKPN